MLVATKLIELSQHYFQLDFCFLFFIKSSINLAIVSLYQVCAFDNQKNYDGQM